MGLCVLAGDTTNFSSDLHTQSIDAALHMRNKPRRSEHCSSHCLACSRARIQVTNLHAGKTDASLARLAHRGWLTGWTVRKEKLRLWHLQQGSSLPGGRYTVQALQQGKAKWPTWQCSP